MFESIASAPAYFLNVYKRDWFTLYKMTKRLFDQDPYATECEATVVSIQGLAVQVDQTVFFAFSGGQASDSVTIGGISVATAVKDEGNITYTLEEAPTFKVDDKVQIKIDGERRDKIRRLHSAIHIVDLLFRDQAGIGDLIGSNIEENKGRLDHKSPTPITDLLPKTEEAANEFISHGYEIKRWDDEKDPNKRWWACNNWKEPCGGTHPKSTEEIGKIKLKRKNIGSGKERIEVTLA